ncbi:MAG: methyltransferase domain-containing protein [Desulfobacterales bacterium]|nr:methyltransferase domain-containing protein [Desulfobacterales bacterium]
MIETAQSHNSHVCPHKFAFMLDNWIRRLLQNPEKILKGYINPGDTVMDVGCGPGFFTIDMAKMVGPEGRVIAVDLQAKMLTATLKKAARKGVAGQVVAHQCEADRIGFDEQVDFILAYYMVHETSDPPAFFKEAKAMLKESGRLLVVEPKMHVSKSVFEAMVGNAEKAGLDAIDFPGKKGGYCVLLTA